MESRPHPHAMLASLWDRYRPLMLSRLDLLDRAAATHPLPPELRDEALTVAHNFAGSLGMFGFAEGTRIARELEQELETESDERLDIEGLCRELRANLFGETTG